MKATRGITLALLLTSILTVAFNVPPIVADGGFAGLPEDHQRIRQADGDEPSNLTDPRESFLSEGFNRNASAKENPMAGPVDEDRWNFNRTNEWGDFAKVDGDSAELIVGVDNGKPNSYADIVGLISENGGDLVGTVSMGGEIRAVVADIPLAAGSSFVTEVRDASLSRYIEPNMKFQACFLPNDPYWSYQWGPRIIDADYAWNTTIGDPSVLVAIVDTGIDWNHPDLAANYIPLGYDWVNDDTDPMDDEGHGTHCAGITAAAINNGVGIAGLAQVHIMAEKGLDWGGWGTEDDLANAIAHAVDQGADILSLSWGSYVESALIHDAIKYAYDAGVLVIASAGNDATSIKLFPAAFDEVIAVTATNEYDDPAWFPGWWGTNFGEWVELAAPGVDIYSTVWDDSYTYMSGTSMSTPHVAGVAALIWSVFPNVTRDWVRLWLRYTADDLGDAGFDHYYGYGRINARKTVDQTPPSHDLLISNWERPPYVEPGMLATINTTVLNFGASNETNITVQLLVNGSAIDSAFIGFLASGASATVSCSWSPTVEGLYNVTSYVVVVPDETITENNAVWTYLYVGFPVKAFVLDSAGTDLTDIISTWQVLNTNWIAFGSTMIYIDYMTLNKDDITYDDIVATGADVLIISCAADPWMGWEFTDSEIEAITRYTHEGHGLIATAGTLYNQVPNNNKLAPLFGLDETVTWDATWTDLLHLQDPMHPLFVNIPNPFVFPGVQTAVPSDLQWDENELIGGTYVALGHYQESAIVVFKGLVYISPWLEIIPPHYHFNLQLLYNAITWSSYKKPEHELVVSLEAPACLEPSESTLLNATVSNFGLNNETNVELFLQINGTTVDSATIPELLTDSSCTLTYLWTPTVEAIYNLSAYAPPVPEEEFTANNVDTKMVFVRVFVIENVLVYTDDYVVAPSERYPIVALDNLGIAYTHYADDPTGFVTALTTQLWDLVIVGHNNYYAFGNNWEELEEYVLNGGLLILSTFDVDGSDSEPTTLWSTLGVEWVQDMSYPEAVYRWIPTHPIFTFPNTVGDLASYMEGYYDDGDHVRATTGIPVAGFTASPTAGYASIVVGNGGRTVLISFLVCEFRYDEDGDGKLDTVELWENAIAFVAIPIEHELDVTLEAPAFVKPGDSSLLNATVHNRGLSNETDVELLLLINGTTRENATIPMLLTNSSYTLSYLWTPTVEATYNVTAYAPPVSDEEFILNNVKSVNVPVTRIVVALFKNVDPWDYPSNEEALSLYGIPYVVFSSRDFGYVNLSAFSRVIIASDQDQVFYNAMEVLGWWFEDYVNMGGALEIHAADGGWHGGGWVGTLPGGLQWINYYADYVTIVDPTHPVVTTPNPITDAELDDWWSSVHGYFDTYPADSRIVIIEDSTGMPAYLEFKYGAGFIVASSQTLEYAYMHGYSQILENSLLYVRAPEHDVAVMNIIPSKTVVGQGYSMSINVTVGNHGDFTETFNLTVYANTTIIDTHVDITLTSGNSTTRVFSWNTTSTAKGNYTITAYATPVPGETDTADNTFIDGTVLETIPGDVNGDGTVNIFDALWIRATFGSEPGEPNWNPNADINSDGAIDIYDALIVSGHFGETV